MVTQYYCFKFENQFENFSLHLYPNISLHSLHTVLDTFAMVLTRRVCLTIKIFSW